MQRQSKPPEAHIVRMLACIHLHELQKALHLRGWFTRYEPGVPGPPRLFAWHPVFGALDEAICAVYRAVGSPKPSWWFQWASGDRICLVRNKHAVVAHIAARVKEQS
jgi:hypothetical protein